VWEGFGEGLVWTGQNQFACIDVVMIQVLANSHFTPFSIQLYRNISIVSTLKSFMTYRLCSIALALNISV